MGNDTHRFQKAFRQFHEEIRLTDADHNAVLREKRDRVLTRLRDNLKAQRRTFTMFNQGSYAMSTGIQPLDGDYDIDVGVIFEGSHRPEPMAVKQWVYDGVYGHTGKVLWKHPCITVQYQRAGEAVYHVDLPVYWRDGWGRLYLARGKQHSGAAHREWREEDPKAFIERVKSYGSGEGRKQFRRTIRALKRWRDVHFPSHGAAAPVGVGLTVLALQGFQPHHNTFFSPSDSDYDDLAALIAFVETLRNGFAWGTA